MTNVGHSCESQHRDSSPGVTLGARPQAWPSGREIHRHYIRTMHASCILGDASGSESVSRADGINPSARGRERGPWSGGFAHRRPGVGPWASTVSARASGASTQSRCTRWALSRSQALVRGASRCRTPVTLAAVPPAASVQAAGGPVDGRQAPALTERAGEGGGHTQTAEGAEKQGEEGAGFSGRFRLPRE